MARRVFFSFDYKYVWKVNQIRSMPNVIGTAAAGFVDASIWEEAKKKSDKAIKDMIDKALNNTSVTRLAVSMENGTVSENGCLRKYSRGQYLQYSLERISMSGVSLPRYFG